MYLLADDSDKSDWYSEANDFCEKLTTDTITKNKVIGVLAALSPMKNWNDNKNQAISMIQTGSCGHMPLFKNKAINIINCSGNDEDILTILSGPKIKSFYMNIKNESANTDVTIDRHALSVAIGKRVDNTFYTGMTPNQYEFFKTYYIAVAKRLRIKPSKLQAITWVRFRKIKGDYKKVYSDTHKKKKK